MVNILNKIEEVLVYLGIIIIPLLVLPIFPNPYLGAKLAALCVLTCLLVVNGAVKVIVSGKLKLNFSSFDIGVVILSVVYLTSAFVKTTGKMDAFLNPGTATIVACSSVYYFFIKYYLGKKESLKLALFSSGVASALISLLATSQLLSKIPQLPAFFKTLQFNTEGNSLFVSIFLGITAILGIGLLIKQNGKVQKLFLAICTGIVIFGLTVSILAALPKGAGFSKLPDLNTSWQVTFEALKVSPILGLGPGNYQNIFTNFKPLTFNQSPYWDLTFITGSNYYLTAIASTGFAGLLGLIILWATLFKLAKRNYFQKSAIQILSGIGELEALIVLTLALAIFPASLTIIFIFFVLLALNSPDSQKHINLVGDSQGGTLSKLPAFLVSIPLLAIFGAFGFFSVRAFAAEITFAKAVNSINNTQTAYDSMVKAIQLNPYVDTYHLFFSQFNMALANNIASSQTEITDEQRAFLSQLLQQAIAEGKAAVTINQFKSANWANLGGIYSAILPFVNGADQFAIQTYSQAVALDPINPNLRISLGGVYYALGRYDEAIKVFELATLAKPDHPNAHYNLAVAYRDRGDTQKAIEELKIVLSLVEKDSNDYALAKTELDALEKNVPSVNTQEGEQLNAPEKAEESIITPPIELPQEVVAPEVSPSPTP